MGTFVTDTDKMISKIDFDMCNKEKPMKMAAISYFHSQMRYLHEQKFI